MKPPRLSRSSAAAGMASALLVVVATLVLAACGGSDATASSSPSASSSVPHSSDMTPTTPASTAAPLPRPTVAGTIAFTNVSITESGDADICVIRTDGTGLMQLTDDPGWEEHPSWSPDGKRIVYDAGSSEPFSNSIWIMKADGSGKTELTDGYHPHWSPDGMHIVFVRYPGGSRGEDVFVMNADGSGVRCVIDLTRDDTDPSWAPDGRIVSTVGRDVFSMNLDGSARVRLTKGKNVMDSAESPDGKAVAVAAFGSIGSPLYIVMADGSGLSAVPGIDNAADPAWRPE